MFTKKFNKKKHFEQMICDIDKAIAELELKKFTLVNSRERYRQAYDQARLALETMEQSDKATKEERESAQKQVDKNKTIMDALDREILGAPSNEELPDGIQGVDNQLRSWVERREVAKEFIRLNC